MKKISKFIAPSLSVISFALPFLAMAQVNVTYAKTISGSIISFINSVLVPVLMAVAFIFFIFGVYKYFILGAAEEKSREDGKKFVMWGLIGFVIIFSVWALVAVVSTTLGLTTVNSPTPPTFGAPAGTP